MTNSKEFSKGNWSRPDRRYRKTLAFLEACIGKDERILDLGIANPFTEMMKEHGYQVASTEGEDLDVESSLQKNYDFTCITSFEVFEHLVAPFNLLSGVKPAKGGKVTLVASVPLKVWFAKAYWNNDDPWDRHYHEFEPRQFDWLLEKSGWKVVKGEAWKSPAKLALGIRPWLRFLFPGYYFVHAEKYG